MKAQQLLHNLMTKASNVMDNIQFNPVFIAKQLITHCDKLNEFSVCIDSGELIPISNDVYIHARTTGLCVRKQLNIDQVFYGLSLMHTLWYMFITSIALAIIQLNRSNFVLLEQFKPAVEKTKTNMKCIEQKVKLVQSNVAHLCGSDVDNDTFIEFINLVYNTDHSIKLEKSSKNQIMVVESTSFSRQSSKRENDSKSDKDAKKQQVQKRLA